MIAGASPASLYNDSMRLRTTAVLWFAAAIALYAATAAKGLIWADSSKLTIYALHSYFPSLNPGDHPGWTVLARVWLWLTPWWTAVRSLHLFSAFCGAIAVAAMFLVVAGKTGCRETAHTTATFLLVAHPHWWASTVTETYTPALALTLLATLAGDRSKALLSGVLGGLAVACHGFSLFLLVPVLVGLRRSWPVFSAGVLMGAAPLWLALPLGIPTDPMTGFAAGGTPSWLWHLRTFVEPARLLPGALILGCLLGYSLGPTGLWGFSRSAHVRVWRQETPWVAGISSLAVLTLFLTTYSPFRLHLMVLFLLAGFLLLFPPRLGRTLRIVHIAALSATYIVVPAFLSQLGRADLGVRQLPGRNNAEYFLRPVRTCDFAADRYGLELLGCVPRHSVVLADFNPGAVLKLLQENEGLRTDVQVVPTAVDSALARSDPARHLAGIIETLHVEGKPVVLADGWPAYYRTEELEQRFGLSFQQCGPGLLLSKSSVE